VKILRSAGALASLAFLSFGSPFGVALGDDVVFPPGTEVNVGVPRFRSEEGAWKCKIRCNGIVNVETVVAVRFGFGPAEKLEFTPWKPHGGEIVCNPFKGFSVGSLPGSEDEFPSTCQVALQ
jgi:hypothetical protein